MSIVKPSGVAINVPRKNCRIVPRVVAQYAAGDEQRFRQAVAYVLVATLDFTVSEAALAIGAHRSHLYRVFQELEAELKLRAVAGPPDDVDGDDW